MITPTAGRSLRDLTGSMLHDAILRSDEPGWLGQMRALMFDRFRDRGLPGEFDEQWRGTDLRSMGLLDLPIRFSYGDQNASPIVLDGIDAAGSRSGPLPWVATLSDSVRSFPELVRSYLFGAYTLDATPSLVALNNACLTDGAFVHLPAGHRSTRPLGVSFQPDRLSQLACPHNVVVAAEGSRGGVIEEFRSHQPADAVEGESRIFANAVTEVFVAPGARLDMLTLIDWDDTIRSCHRAVAHVADGGRLRWALGTAGGRMVRVDMEVSLDGPGAESHIVGLGLGTKGRHIDHRTVQHHSCAETTSRINFGTLLTGDSKSIYRGMIRMEPGAFKADAYQKNDNLILGEGPRAQAIPMLEILADDVKCSHGSTVGRLRDEDIFYMTSRGIPEIEARDLIAEGFIRRLLAAGGKESELTQRLFTMLTERFRRDAAARTESEELVETEP